MAENERRANCDWYARIVRFDLMPPGVTALKYGQLMGSRNDLAFPVASKDDPDYLGELLHSYNMIDIRGRTRDVFVNIIRKKKETNP